MLVATSTYFFDSSCNFFVSYVPSCLLAMNDLLYFFGSDMPSRAPGTASLNRCRQRPWYVRPSDRGLGSSYCRGWNGPLQSTHDVEFLLKCLGCLAEMAVSASKVRSLSSGELFIEGLPERLPSGSPSNSLCPRAQSTGRTQMPERFSNSRSEISSTCPRDLELANGVTQTWDFVCEMMYALRLDF